MIELEVCIEVWTNNLPVFPKWILKESGWAVKLSDKFPIILTFVNTVMSVMKNQIAQFMHFPTKHHLCMCMVELKLSVLIFLNNMEGKIVCSMNNSRNIFCVRGSGHDIILLCNKSYKNFINPEAMLPTMTLCYKEAFLLYNMGSLFDITWSQIIVPFPRLI